jgi:signal transduction histidine kinase
MTESPPARRRPDRWLFVAIAVAGIEVGLVAEWVSAYGYYQYSIVDVVRDIAVGWSFMGAGLTAWWRRPESRVGRLMVIVGFTWFIGNFGSTGILPWAPVAGSLQGLQGVFQTQLIVSYPTGRLTQRLERGFVVSMAVVIVTEAVLTLVSLDPATFACPCPENPFLLIHDPRLAAAIAELGRIKMVVLTLALLAVLVRRWLRSTASARRMLAPVWFGAMATTVTSVGAAISVFFGGDEWTAGNVGQAMQIAVPFAFLAGLLRSRLARAGVSDLVVELSKAPSSGSIRSALARTLGDPTLELAFPIGTDGSFVDDRGRPIELPARSGRATTELRHDGRVIAVLDHDPALNEDLGLVEAAGAAARFAIENERLQAELRAQLEEVRASRARLVTTGDIERRRVERDLHDGAQQRLVTLALALRMAREHAGLTGDPTLTGLLDDAANELNVALVELRELARGIHPAILTEEGLGAAIETLANRSSLPVQVRVPAERYPPAVEATAYFVVCEALANVTKHAGASEASVTALRVDGRLRVEIADDGTGGANAAAGSGLQGLVDRVVALGGTFRFESPPGRGTLVVAEIPCG